jgi:tRNA-dihydrouridine synthase B
MKEKGEYVAVREMRKHAGWYLKGIPGSASARRKLNTIVKAEALKEMISQIKA